MATFLVAHGAWSAGWVWKKMRPLLRELGHELFTPTYTGLGECAHRARHDVGLETHIGDILGVLQFEDLRNVILIGTATVVWWPPAWPTEPRSAWLSSCTLMLSCPTTGNANLTFNQPRPAPACMRQRAPLATDGGFLLILWRLTPPKRALPG